MPQYLLGPCRCVTSPEPGLTCVPIYSRRESEATQFLENPFLFFLAESAPLLMCLCCKQMRPKGIHSTFLQVCISCFLCQYPLGIGRSSWCIWLNLVILDLYLGLEGKKRLTISIQMNIRKRSSPWIKWWITYWNTLSKHLHNWSFSQFGNLIGLVECRGAKQTSPIAISGYVLFTLRKAVPKHLSLNHWQLMTVTNLCLVF